MEDKAAANQRMISKSMKTEEGMRMKIIQSQPQTQKKILETMRTRQLKAKIPVIALTSNLILKSQDEHKLHDV